MTHIKGHNHKVLVLSDPVSYTISTVYFYSCVFGKRNYRVLGRVSACVCVCVCTITQKEIDLHEIEIYVVYESSLNEFDIELRRFKVKVKVA